MENCPIQRLTEKKLTLLQNFLQSNSLPFTDMEIDKHLFFGVFDKDELIGSVGIELYNQSGLFRSLAVKSEYQKNGLGKRLHDHIISYCLQNGVKTLFLLTTTASSYFEKMGWSKIQRNETPEQILQSEEFASLCPSTAVCMTFQVYSDNIDYTGKIFASGFNCAQSVFVPVAVDKGISASAAFKLSTGFGAGMVYRGETCGAITGAMMAIGLVHGRFQAENTDSRDKTYKLINKLYDDFSAKHGAILCKELLNADITNPEEVKRIGMAGAFTTLCPKFVKDAAIITDMLAREQ